MRLLVAAAAVVAACAVTTPAHATGCFTFTDAVGDTAIDGLGIADAEPDLDIVGVEYVTTTDSVGARIEVAALGDRPAKAPGDVFQVGFTHAGTYVDIYAERVAGTVILGSSVPAGLTVTGTVDRATNSVTVTVLKSDIEALAGASLTGARLDDLNAGASADYGTWVLYDESWPAAGTTYSVGSICH